MLDNFILIRISQDMRTNTYPKCSIIVVAFSIGFHKFKFISIYGTKLKRGNELTSKCDGSLHVCGWVCAVCACERGPVCTSVFQDCPNGSKNHKEEDMLSQKAKDSWPRLKITIKGKTLQNHDQGKNLQKSRSREKPSEITIKGKCADIRSGSKKCL